MRSKKIEDDDRRWKEYLAEIESRKYIKRGANQGKYSEMRIDETNMKNGLNRFLAL